MKLKTEMLFEPETLCPWCYRKGIQLLLTRKAEKRTCAKGCGYYAWIPRKEKYGKVGESYREVKRVRKQDRKIRKKLGKIFNENRNLDKEFFRLMNKL
jgi:hypothetical protein